MKLTLMDTAELSMPLSEKYRRMQRRFTSGELRCFIDEFCIALLVTHVMFCRIRTLFPYPGTNMELSAMSILMLSIVLLKLDSLQEPKQL